jgi:hypothetical protein
MRRIMRAAALVAMIGCLLAFFSFEAGSSATGAWQRSWISIGQPWHWYENRIEQEIRPDGSQTGTGEAGVILRSPAWLLLIGAVVGFVAFHRFRPRTPAAAPA